MRVAIVGPRNLKLSVADIALGIEQSGFAITYLLTGDARGVDESAREYAKHFLPSSWKEFEAHWNTRGNAAGPYRNWWMINKGGGAEALIAFVRDDKSPCTSGTASSIAEAVIKGIPVHIVKV